MLETLGRLGRTEDVRLAPDGRRLAIACYAEGRVAIGEIDLSRVAGHPQVALASMALHQLPLLLEPHGLDWVDDETLVVANRAGRVAILRLDGAELNEVEAPDGQVQVDAPGSVAVRPLGARRHEVLVCDNWRNRVARYELDEHGALSGGQPLLEAWLDLPDGIAFSRDGRWVAVSNHNTRNVTVFEREAAGQRAEPVAVLRGVEYPHGLRFAAGDRRLLVADAGAPRVHVFAAQEDGWAGAAYPVASVDVMDEATFLRGRANPKEGGPKGIDVDPGSNILLATCEEMPLACFDLATVLESPERFAPDVSSLLRLELAALEERDEARQAAADAHAALSAVLSTKAWRLTAPARRLRGALALRRSPQEPRQAEEPVATLD